MGESPVPGGRWLHIKALFAGAVEQPPDAVDAWLDEQCGGDDELRREVESLLASHRSAASFLETPAIEEPGAARAVADSVGPSIHSAIVGRRLGPYRLVSEIGRGGMGVVYLAERDDEAFSRRVAIKMVHGGVLHPSLVDRFEAERRILARFEHPNIAQLLDAGTDDGGTPFAVMEYVEGVPIDAYARDHHLSIARRLELFCAVCDAVQYSHERLVVHRDIKPRNVLVTGDGVPKLLDFGIAKLLDPSGAATDRTRTDLRALTPESASPEQVRGEPITVASDVYSLGVLLFRLLTGASPYRGTLQTELDMARAICDEEAPRPSEVLAEAEADLSRRQVGARRRALEGDLDLITLKALRKEPKRRYASVERLASDIRRHLAGQPVEAVPDSWRYRSGKFLRRHRIGLAAAAAIVAALTAGVAMTLYQAHVARVERELAERRFNEVRGLARSMIFEVYDAIEPLPGSTAARELLMRRALEYLDRLAMQPGTDPSLQRELASAYVRIGSVQGHGGVANLGQQTAAVESYLKAVGIRERLARAAPSDRAAQRDLAGAQLNLGLVLWSIGNNPGALALVRSSVSLNEWLVAGQPWDVPAQVDLGRSYLALSDLVLGIDRDWEQTLSLLQKALPLFRHAAEAAPADARTQRALAGTYKRIGRVEAGQGHYASGLEAYRSALAIDERRLDLEPNSPEARMDVGIDISEIGSTFVGLGDLRKGLAHGERARAIAEDLVRADPKDTHVRVLLAEEIHRVARVQWLLGHREQALASRRSGLAHLEALAEVKPNDVDVQERMATELANVGLGYAQVDAGRSADARCARARPFLMRAFEAYQHLPARGQQLGDGNPTLREVRAAFRKCGGDR